MTELKTVKKNILTNWPNGPGLMWIDHPDEPLECDFCDNTKPLAHIDGLGGQVFCICRDCLQTFANAFNDD